MIDGMIIVEHHSCVEPNNFLEAVMSVVHTFTLNLKLNKHGSVFIYKLHIAT